MLLARLTLGATTAFAIVISAIIGWARRIIVLCKFTRAEETLRLYPAFAIAKTSVAHFIRFH